MVVSCLASRTGGRKDSWAIDHAATLNTYEQGRAAGVAHYVLLSHLRAEAPAGISESQAGLRSRVAGG